MSYDLILRGGRVVDPSQKLDAVTDVAFAGGKVARIGAGLRPDAKPMSATYPATSSPRD
jgi:dihydroorotase